MKGPNKMTMNFDGANPWPMKNIYKGVYITPLSANPTKWSNTLKQFVGFCRQIVWVYLTILWSWRLKS